MLFCIYQVWMTLEQKRIPYRVEKINMRCYGDKPMSFMSMQPSGNIPVAVINGVTYNQSNDIMYALEEQFPDRILFDRPSLFQCEAKPKEAHTRADNEKQQSKSGFELGSGIKYESEYDDEDDQVHQEVLQFWALYGLTIELDFNRYNYRWYRWYR